MGWGVQDSCLGTKEASRWPELPTSLLTLCSRAATPLQEEETPVPAAALGGFKLVFDAVYTPLHTRLLR